MGVLRLLIGVVLAIVIYVDARKLGNAQPTAAKWALGSLVAPLLSPLILVGFFALYFLFGRRAPKLSRGDEQIIDIDAQPIEEMVICPSCSRKVQYNFTSCPHCKAVLKVACEHCGRALESNWRTCPYCSASIGRK